MSPPLSPAARPFAEGESFVSPQRALTARECGRGFASDWQTLALTLELAGPLCLREGRAIKGSCLLEMHWWGQVRAGDALQVHARRLQDATLLWTVNQSGRCVFSCLALIDKHAT